MRHCLNTFQPKKYHPYLCTISIRPLLFDAASTSVVVAGAVVMVVVVAEVLLLLFQNHKQTSLSSRLESKYRTLLFIHHHLRTDMRIVATRITPKQIHLRLVDGATMPLDTATTTSSTITITLQNQSSTDCRLSLVVHQTIHETMIFFGLVMRKTSQSLHFTQIHQKEA